MRQTVIVVILFFTSTLLLGQGFTPPKKGHAVVYFTRVAAYQKKVPFTYFDGDSLIADFPSLDYARYECKAGKHLFWAHSDNKAFIPAMLKEGQTYVIYVEAKQGASLPNVVLTAIDTKHANFHLAKHLIFNKPPHPEEHKKLVEENQRMDNFIKRTVDEYQTANPNPTLLLTPEMAIPIEKIK